ncbi:MAG: hypothetical protein GU346_05580 [Thermocrinis sp.]|jgi:hypothetical protein|nr:hypothetical protein [Thermocrinis sp.]
MSQMIKQEVAQLRWFRKLWVVLVFVMVLLQGQGFGGEKEKIKISKLNIAWSTAIANGLSYIDLDGDGEKDVVVRGYRSNISAHSFSVISFYLVKKITNQKKIRYNFHWSTA